MKPGKTRRIHRIPIPATPATPAQIPAAPPAKEPAPKQPVPAKTG